MTSNDLFSDPSLPHETRRELVAGAHRRFGAIPGEWIVDHLLRTTPGADFPVREAALDALRRRWDFARRDALRLASRPPGRAVLGAYATARAEANGKSDRKKMRSPRPYTSVLESVTPVRASCDCPDFLRSSLGLCKHLLVVLDHVFSAHPRAVDGAHRSAAARAGVPRLGWAPELALTGPLDRLEGLRLEGGNGALDVARAFERGVVNPRVVAHPARRRELLGAIVDALTPSGRRSARLDASPAARALVREELDRVERRVRHGEAAQKALANLGTLGRKLYPYQREGVERFLRSGRLLLADDMGLGKTTQAIAACHALFRSGAVTRGIVVVPASLKPQWLREWQSTTTTPASIVDGTPDERSRQYRDLESGFLILGYEQLLRDFEHVQRVAPEIVVLDEAQRIKNYATKSAAYVKALQPEYRLVLTGTPMENRLEELASILDWVDDVALAPKWRLVPWYTAWEGDAGRGKVGARNLDTLRTRLRGSVLRRVRQEVLSQLPPRTDTRVPVQMTPQQLDEHDALNQPIAKLIQIGKRRPLLQAEFLKLMQLMTQQRIISNGLGQLRFDDLWPTYARAKPDAALLDGLFSPKLVELRRLVSDLVVEQDRKVVVFSQWRRMLRLAAWSVQDVLTSVGARAVFFTGAEKTSQRTQSIVDFHDDPRARVMFLSDAGGVGLNLQHAANACINLELPWNPAVLEQRIGRIYRLGQNKPIDVYNLVSEVGIESRIAGLVATKRALFSGLFDGTSDEIRFDGAASFLTQVERVIDPGPLPEVPSFAADDAEPDDAVPASAEADGAEVAITEVVPARLSAAPRPGAASTAALFEALKVERTPEGGLKIEAPPEAAGALAALFAGMAKLLGSAAAPQ